MTSQKEFRLHALMCAIGGVLNTSKLLSAQPAALTGLEMDVLSGVILGGASIFGGEGTVFGTVCAVAIITVVSNSMLLIGIDTYWQSFFNGLVILIGVTVSALQAMRQKH